MIPSNQYWKGRILMKSFGVKPYLFPMSVYMIGTYNEDGSMDQMAMAWGGICAEDMVALNLEEAHKTVANLKARGAFTLAVPGVDTIKECDYLGTASAVDFPDKCAKAGLHAVKSEHVDAPVVPEFPLTLECRVIYSQREDIDLLEESIRNRAYRPSAEGVCDIHTAYYGRIQDAYIIEED